MMGGRGIRVEQLKFRTFIFQFLAKMFIKYFTVRLSIHAAIGKVIVETFGSESIEDGPFGGNIDEAKILCIMHFMH